MTSETPIGGLPEGPCSTHPLTSSAPASYTLVAQGGREAGAGEPALNHGLRAPAREPEEARARESTAGPGGEGTGLRRHDPAESISPTARCPQR